jgi:hypothetical protein
MSILGDGLMGALDVGRSYLQADIKAEAKSKEADETAARQEATDIRRDDMAQKRAIATEQLKEEFARSNEKAKYARLGKEADAIDDEVLNKKAGLINSIRSSVPNEGEFANQKISESDLDTIRKNMTPEDAEKYYGVKPETALSKVDDQIAAARKVGAYESRPALIEQRKTLFETDKADRKEKNDKEERERKAANDQKNAEIKEEKNRITEEGNIRRAEIAEKRMLGAISKLGGGKDGTVEQFKIVDSDRKRIHEAESSIRASMNAELKDMSPTKRKAITDAYAPKLEEIAKMRKQSDADFNFMRKKVGMPLVSEEEPKPSAEPKASTAPVSKAEYDKLPKGAKYTHPDGSIRTKG